MIEISWVTKKMQRKTIIRKEIRKQLLKKNKKDNKKRTAEKTKKKRRRRKKEWKEKRKLDELLVRAYVYIANGDEMRASEVTRLQNHN